MREQTVQMLPAEGALSKVTVKWNTVIYLKTELQITDYDPDTTYYWLFSFCQKRQTSVGLHEKIKNTSNCCWNLNVSFLHWDFCSCSINNIQHGNQCGGDRTGRFTEMLDFSFKAGQSVGEQDFGTFALNIMQLEVRLSVCTCSRPPSDCGIPAGSGHTSLRSLLVYTHTLPCCHTEETPSLKTHAHTNRQHVNLQPCANNQSH